jgi:hypothetical protein
MRSAFSTSPARTSTSLAVVTALVLALIPLFTLQAVTAGDRRGVR